VTYLRMNGIFNYKFTIN